MEFALVVPILLLVFGMAIDFSRLFFTYIGVENAAREGAVYGTSNARCWNSAISGCADPENITFHTRQELGGDPALTVTVSCSPCSVSWAGLGNRITVTASREFGFAMPVIGRILGDPFTVRATAVAVITR